jgi:hypothetical protein
MLREMGCRRSTPTNGAGKCAPVSWVGAARELWLRVGLCESPVKDKLARSHAIQCWWQGLECAPSCGIQPIDACKRCYDTFFAGKRGLKPDRMALGHTAPDPDGAVLRILASSRTLKNASLQ